MSIWITTPPQVMPFGSCSPCGTGALSSEVSHLENRPGPCHGRIGVRYQPIQLHTARGNWWKCPQTPEPHDPSSVTYVSALTTHDLEPSRSRTQSAFSWHGLGDPSGQKRCPRRWQPDVWSPTKPGWQGPHWKDPCAQARSVSRSHHPLPSILTICAFLTRVLTQTELGTQLCCPVSHSLISVQTWETETTDSQHKFHPGHASLQPPFHPDCRNFLAGTRMWTEFSAQNAFHSLHHKRRVPLLSLPVCWSWRRPAPRPRGWGRCSLGDRLRSESQGWY